MNRLLASLSCSLLLSAFGLCQVLTSLSTGPNSVHGTIHFSGVVFRGPVIAGAPYSAEKVHEHVQTLADGTHITQTTPIVKVYRDAMGRTRTERPATRGPIERRANGPERPTIVEINDPIAHVRYVFTSEEPVAHRQDLPADNLRGAFPGRQPGVTGITGTTGVVAIADDLDDTIPPPPPNVRAIAPLAEKRQRGDEQRFPQITKEDLGTQTIEGLEAEGKRNTMTWPVDAIGNDRPIVNISETWTSAELKEVIVRKSNDPRSGENTFKLVNVSRSEPDPSLFEPPPGYTVKDEAGDFTITWTTPL
jgi:hypothetical protein